MIDCISVENMRESDRVTIETKVPGLALMWRAALGIYRAVQWQGKIAILAGSGNNGGDGYALACILAANGYSCEVRYLGSRRSADAAYYAEKAAAAGVPISPFVAGEQQLADADFIVDCLLGTGFQGEVRADYRAAIAEINEAGGYADARDGQCAEIKSKSGACIVSADINSGMNGDTGEADVAVLSDVTVAIGYVKNGMMNPDAARYMKRLVCVDIGIDLVKEENKISKEITEKTVRDGHIYFPWPEYLDEQVIEVRE